MSAARLAVKFALCLGITSTLEKAGEWNGASFLAGIGFLFAALVIDRVWEAA